jgi:hypothetical protein
MKTTTKLNEPVNAQSDLDRLKVAVVRAETRLIEARCAVLREKLRLKQASGRTTAAGLVALVAQQFAPPPRRSVRGQS